MSKTAISRNRKMAVSTMDSCRRQRMGKPLFSVKCPRVNESAVCFARRKIAAYRCSLPKPREIVTLSVHSLRFLCVYFFSLAWYHDTMNLELSK